MSPSPFAPAGGLANARIALASPERVVVRAAAPEAYDARTLATLGELEVTTIVDLRERTEGAGAPPAGSDLRVVRAPLYDDPAGPPVIASIEGVYDGLLDTRGVQLASAVRAIARAPRGVLVHCAIGKDRTGIVCALAQQAAGFDDEDIVADYARSEGHVTAVRREAVERELARSGADADELEAARRLHLESPPEAMRHLLARLREEGGAAAYLARHGLAADELEALRRFGPPEMGRPA